MKAYKNLSSKKKELQNSKNKAKGIFLFATIPRNA